MGIRLSQRLRPLSLQPLTMATVSSHQWLATVRLTISNSNNNIYINAKGDDYFNKFERGPNNYLRQADSPHHGGAPQPP